jgi:hypothetical protein
MLAHSLIALLLGSVAAAASGPTPWQRMLVSGKGASFDTPGVYSLSYFTHDPFLRDDGDDFCGACTPQDKTAARTQHKFKTELKKVGALNGYAIYDVSYFFDDHVSIRQVDWKSILVAVSPGRYREIYHLQPPAAQITPSFLMMAGAEEILATRNLIPGTGNQYDEAYWWFGPDGPVRIDIESISDLLPSILPAGYGVWKGGGLNMKTLTFRSSVWKPGDANCCPAGGAVTSRFRLDRERLMLIEKSYDATAMPPD